MFLKKAKDFVVSKMTSKKFITACLVSAVACMSCVSFSAEDTQTSQASLQQAVTSSVSIVKSAVDVVTSNEYTLAFLGLGVVGGGLRTFKRARKSSGGC